MYRFLHEDVGARLREAGITWVNTVIECVGRPSTIEQAIDLAGNKAVVMMFGLTKPDEVISVKPFQIFNRYTYSEIFLHQSLHTETGAGSD